MYFQVTMTLLYVILRMDLKLQQLSSYGMSQRLKWAERKFRRCLNQLPLTDYQTNEQQFCSHQIRVAVFLLINFIMHNLLQNYISLCHIRTVTAQVVS